MRAEIFYRSTSEQALPLSLLSKTQVNDGLNGLSDFERNRLFAERFTGSLGDVALINDSSGKTVKFFVGAGEGNEAMAVAYAVNKLPAGSYVSEETLSNPAILAWSLAQYRFDKYKQIESTPRILSVQNPDLSNLIAEARAVFLVRDLINTPTNDMGPGELAKVVSDLAMEFGGQFKQWIGDELISDNFPAIHAVGRASVSPPRLLSLTWGDEAHPKVTLVGKGVCFDSGGLNIKPGTAMRLMKKDMGGAAQVIGLAVWLMAEKCPIRLHVLIPAVENSVGSNAFRPGDVLTMRNGLTVEIDNTDAEGRLVLADALVKACEEKPELIIDFATLTGAARVAVGTEIAAMFTPEDALSDAISRSAKDAEDPVWRLPLHASYSSMLESNIADLANSNDSSYAGAITAALFLQRFTSGNIPWVHFDVMAWNLRSKPGRPEGGEAMGIRAVGRYLKKRYG